VAGKSGGTGWPVKVVRGANRPALCIRRVASAGLTRIAPIDRGGGVIGERGRASPRCFEPVEYLHQLRER
jgi:hypothetical protein